MCSPNISITLTILTPTHYLRHYIKISGVSKVLEISESTVEKVSEMKGVLFVKFGAEKQKNIESQQSGSSSQSDGLTTEPLELIH